MMKVRIRLRLDSARALASVAAAFLTPAAVMALVLGLWRLCCDLKWAGDFAISQGLFSHWQVWIAMAGLLQTCAAILNRYGRGGGEAMP